MKKIGFIGAFEKTNLMLYLARLLVLSGKKVLAVDTTRSQRARYIVPCMTPSIYYITTFQEIDVAVGFNDMTSILNYLGAQEIKYDFVLVDIDSNQAFNGFDMVHADKNYFVTAFDNYSLKRGLEILGNMEEKIRMTKVLFSRDMLEEEDDYLNFLSFYYAVIWDEEKIFFPYEQGDNTVHIENQRAATIRYRDLSQNYKEGLLIILQEIEYDIKANEIRKIFKTS